MSVLEEYSVDAAIEAASDLDACDGGYPLPKLPTYAQVAEAMQSAWDEFCDDTLAHPDDIYREGRKTFFRAGTWARMTANFLRAAMLAEPTNKDEIRAGGSCTQRRIPMENDITRDDRARIDALAHAVRRPASTEMSADQIVADAEKFYNFLIAKS